MSSKSATPKKKKLSISEGKASGTTKKNPGSSSQQDDGTAAAAASSARGSGQQHEKVKGKNRRVEQPANSGSSSKSSSTGLVRKTMTNNSSASAGGSGASNKGKQWQDHQKKRQLKEEKEKQQQQHKQQQQQKQRQLQKHKQRRPTGLRPKVLLHELAAQKYAAFLAESSAHAHLPPLSYYRRPRRKRQRPDLPRLLMGFRVPQAGPVEGTHIHQFAPEWRKPMTIEPEQLGAFYKPGGGVIEPTLQPPPELKLSGIQGKDLNQGYLNYVEPDTASSTSEISEMLDETPGLEREEESAHFITYRNNLNKILVAPYSKQKWEIQVFKEGGIIYLEVVSDRNRGMMDRTSYWGRRFETLCVLGVEGARLDELQRGPNDPTRPSYCALFRSRLGSHNLLMGAEIDACRPNEPGRFVEIKTTRNLRDAKDEQIFKKHKALKYWVQCYLAGVRDLVVGYRDDHGIVREIKSWTTDTLVESVDKFKHWDKDVCLNFADRCLSFLKDNVDEGPRYSFKFVEPFDEITLEVMDAQQAIDPVTV